MSPIIAPLGFGTWQAGATLIPGFLAKEVIISSMAISIHPVKMVWFMLSNSNSHHYLHMPL